VNFGCLDKATLAADNGGPYGTWSPYAKCPTGSAVCGMQSRVEGRQGSGDDTAMNGVRLMCCTL
jgi:Vitelline membrane outer layer protein I (VOMI)